MIIEAWEKELKEWNTETLKENLEALRKLNTVIEKEFSMYGIKSLIQNELDIRGVM